jgi:hypothetical protein
MNRDFLRSPALGAATVLSAWAALWFSVLFALAPGVIGG